MKQEIFNPAIPKALHVGILELGASKLPCANLPDGRRVLSETGLVSAFTGRRGGASRGEKERATESERKLPYFLGKSMLKPFIPEDSPSALFTPIHYILGDTRVVTSYDATILPIVCNVWIQARDAGVLKNTKDLQKAERAEAILNALAQVGIAALIDEATGYQKEREDADLQRLLAKYLSDYQLDWARMFHHDFYKEIFRLHGWDFNLGNNSRSPLVGKITADIIYERLPENVLELLREKNPVINKVTHRRRATHHQYLSPDVGQPHLRDRLGKVITLLKASTTWSGFMEMLDRVFPKHPSVEDI